MEKRVYVCEGGKVQELKKVLEADPYDADSFAAQGYTLKSADSLGLEGDNYYLCIKADEEFFKKAEEKIGGVVKRAEKDVEEKIVKKIEEEQNSAASGFGAIFG